MIYLFAGDYTDKKIPAYENFLGAIGDGTEIFSFNKNDFDYTQIESLYSGAGLFFTKCAVIFINIFENKEAKEFLLKNLTSLAESPNDFIFLEGKLLKTEQDAFKSARAEINYFELPKEKKEKYDNFLVANAFGAKDKFYMWYHFRRAMDLGVGMEEIIGVLFWKVKDMILRGDFRHFKKEFLQDFAGRLSYLLPEARKRGEDDEAVFEQFLLEAF